MPSKNMYIAESDLPVFKRAFRLAGEMSVTVAAGLRLYLAQHKKNQEGADMETIELRVDDGGVVRTKRFFGRPLLRRRRNEGLRACTFNVYATTCGQYAVYTHNEPGQSRMSAEDDDSPLRENQEAWEDEQWDMKRRKLHVFRDITGMRGKMPDYLIDEIERAESQPMIEDLDT